MVTTVTTEYLVYDALLAHGFESSLLTLTEFISSEVLKNDASIQRQEVVPAPHDESVPLRRASPPTRPDSVPPRHHHVSASP
jgi:hypothetical protein